MYKKYVFILLIFYAGFGVISSYAEEHAPKLQLTSSQTTATTGDTVKFTLTLPRSVSGAIVRVGIKISESSGESNEYDMTKLTGSVYELNFEVTGETSGKLAMRASVFAEENGQLNWLVSNVIEMMIIPKMNELRGMKIVSDESITLFIGGEQQIDVLGTFEDGHNRFIGEGVMGTNYEITGDPGIASVNADGIIKGLKEGNGTLIVRNGNITATAKIIVHRSIPDIKH